MGTEPGARGQLAVCKGRLGAAGGALALVHHHLHQTEKLLLSAPEPVGSHDSQPQAGLGHQWPSGALVLTWGHSGGMIEHPSQVLKSGRGRGAQTERKNKEGVTGQGQRDRETWPHWRLFQAEGLRADMTHSYG